jgi:hypothetical protein
MGKLDSTCVQPPTQGLEHDVFEHVVLLGAGQGVPAGADGVEVERSQRNLHVVAVQVEFEKANVETSFSLDGFKG